MKKYKLIIFDWDGTLMDSVSLIVKTFQAAAREMQIDVPSSKKLRSYIGLNVIDHMQEIFSSGEKQQLIECYTKNRAKYFSKMEMFAGSTELLQKLHAAGYTLAIATSRYRKGLEIALHDQKLAHLFSAIRCADDGFPKPNPGMLWGILEETGFGRKEAIMVGDSEHDLELASNAGIDSIAVTYGVQKRENLLHHHPVECFDDLLGLGAFFLTE